MPIRWWRNWWAMSSSGPWPRSTSGASRPPAPCSATMAMTSPTSSAVSLRHQPALPGRCRAPGTPAGHRLSRRRRLPGTTAADRRSHGRACKPGAIAPGAAPFARPAGVGPPGGRLMGRPPGRWRLAGDRLAARTKRPGTASRPGGRSVRHRRRSRLLHPQPAPLTATASRRSQCLGGRSGLRAEPGPGAVDRPRRHHSPVPHSEV